MVEMESFMVLSLICEPCPSRSGAVWGVLSGAVKRSFASESIAQSVNAVNRQFD